ncbi:uncharacterized protein LOC122860307 [Aphidius gifuensis]|uniref:uncharacterized protein LOC122860307 n=1 Tax=Aphidius gifuensis TaxID=684658 RepID=UPI001CDCB959|nr:uncharacterized protein LOC122860307 [Aphidius gifuensis]
MPRQRIERTPEEEEEFQRAKRQKNANRQRSFRQRRVLEQAHLQNIELDLNNIEEHYIGSMTVLCKHCNAKHFKAEEPGNKKNSFNDCCCHGEVCLGTLPVPPKILTDLFTVNFNPNNHSGPYCFKIHGQIYYQLNTSLYPASNDSPAFGQFFIVDQNESSNIRCNESSQLDRQIVDAIDKALRECNIYAQSYQMMHEEIRQAVSNNPLEPEPEMNLIFLNRQGIDERRYNDQRVNEVAAIFTTTADGEIPGSYVSIRNKQTKKLELVSSMNPNIEPWVYPMYYPHGTRGWHDK